MPTAMVSHLPFFEALAGDAGDQPPIWHDRAAGLLALRLFDQWLRAERRMAPAPDRLRALAVRAEAEALDPRSAVRDSLLRLVDAMLHEPSDGARVRTAMIEYAGRLRHEAEWLLAADVFRTVLEARDLQDVSPQVRQAALECAYCARMGGDLDEAATAYEVGEALAVAARDQYGALRAQVGKAKLTVHRGNLPQAEAELDAIVALAERAASRPGLAIALAERMVVAGKRGQYERAAVFGYRALQQCDDDVMRESILADIATALGDGGHRAASRDAHLVLSATARDSRVRFLSTINLLVLSAQDGQRAAFDQYRAVLDAAPLPAELGARYALEVGHALVGFDDRDAAAAAYNRALTLGERFQVHDVVLQADEALRTLAPATRERVFVGRSGKPVRTDDDSITEVISAMRSMREQALAGAV